MELEKEIKKESERIEKRKTEIETEISDLNSRIQTFTNWAWTFVWIGISVALFGVVIYLCSSISEPYGLNLLGDFMAGTVASVWSLAGLFFIYVAFLGQKQQLLNQQVEIMYSQLEVKYTRLELAGQKKEMKAQNQTLKQQKFETTFFNLISILQDILEDVTISESNKEYKGKEAMNRYLGKWSEMRVRAFQQFKTEKSLDVNVKLNDLEFEQVYEISKTGFENYSNVYFDNIGPYYRLVTRIIDYVDSTELIENVNKGFYIDLLDAKLSRSEAYQIYFYSHYGAGRGGLNKLIVDYRMLGQLDYSQYPIESKMRVKLENKDFLKET